MAVLALRDALREKQQRELALLLFVHSERLANRDQHASLHAIGGATLGAVGKRRFAWKAASESAAAIGERRYQGSDQCV
jgi:hypothetical protein